jgi:hypothetical protein
MGDAVDDRNHDSAERLVALADRLSDRELATVIDAPWTAAGLFAHTAFWDRFVLERWRHAARRGDRTPEPVDAGFQDLINDAALPQWLAIPPRTAAEQCAAAARDVDAAIRALEDDVRSEILGDGRERLVDRSLHRRAHLDTLERAFPA